MKNEAFPFIFIQCDEYRDARRMAVCLVGLQKRTL